MPDSISSKEKLCPLCDWPLPADHHYNSLRDHLATHTVLELIDAGLWQRPSHETPPSSKTWCDIRNKHIRLLRQLLDHTEEDEEAAVRWAIQRLEGLPEHWKYVESPDETPAVRVEGDMLPTTLAQFELRASRLLEDEQAKANPDNALIGFLCDAVRLARENERLATSPLKASGLSPLDMSPKEFEIARQRASQKTAAAPLAGVDFLQVWMRAPNPMLGNSTPLAMLKANRGHKLAQFIEDAYEGDHEDVPAVPTNEGQS